ncbi:MAG: hydroxypyruvate isomerase family protein [Candidatus Accumulibacter sp.]|nr:hydroxypyruvate isomerase family protein [Accumulibacter sp.]
MLRFAANLSFMYQELPFLDRFAAAAADGFTGVEYLFPYDVPAEEIAARLRAHRLEQVLFNLPPGDWRAGERGLACLPGRAAEFAAGVDLALRYAEILDTRRLHVMAGIPQSGMDEPTCRASYVNNLRLACARLADAGRTALIEPINTRDMPGYFLNRQQDAQTIIATVGAANLRLQMDFYHLQIAEGDLSVNLRRYRHLLGHVQIAGVPDRHEPDDGEVNFSHLFDLLEASGYDGWIGCEYRPRAGTSAGLDWLRVYRERHGAAGAGAA